MGAKEIESKHSAGKAFQIFETCLNTLNHVFIGFITIYLTWHIFRRDLTDVPLHAWLCTIGFQCLAAEGILIMYPANSWTTLIPFKIKKMLHWILQVIGNVLGLAGVVIIILHVRGEHFVSLHGALGIAGTVIMLFNFASGLCTFYAPKLKKVVRPVIMKAFHNFIGISGFVLVLASLYYGYFHLQRQIDPNLVRVFEILTVITIILSLMGAFKSLFRQLHSIAD